MSAAFWNTTGTVCSAVHAVWRCLGYLVCFCWAMLQPKAVLAARILALQSQLAVCKHRVQSGKAPAPRFNQAFKILWVILSKLLDRWEDLAQIMRPATVVKWHRTAYCSPWQNPYVERFVGTLRRELLDHPILLNERHLERLLAEFIERYYHTERPHQGLDGHTPVPHAKPPEFTGPTKLFATPVLGGLHHTYRRVAA